jgi:hypothetical protein
LSRLSSSSNTKKLYEGSLINLPEKESSMKLIGTK